MLTSRRSILDDAGPATCARIAIFSALLFLPLAACECSSSVGGDGDGGAQHGGGDGGAPLADGGGGQGGDGGGLPGSDGGGTAGCIAGLTSLSLTPDAVTLIVDGGALAPITFTASGVVNGASAAIDAGDLAWSAERDDDTHPGDIVAGVFTPHPLAGGAVTIIATDGCQTATASVLLTVDATLGSPSDPSAWTATPTTTGTVPVAVYPSDETRIPRNIFRQIFQWQRGGYDEFRITFAGPGGSVQVYTDGQHELCAANATTGCWEADETSWELIAGSNAGAEVSWTIDGLDGSTSPATLRRSLTSVLGISKRDVRGAIFYWSTTSKGIRRANLHDGAPEDYITGDPGTLYAPDDEVNCVACHTVSRDGRFIAAPTDAASGKSLWILEVTATAPPNPLVKYIENTGGHMFATFSPDNEHVVAATKKEGMFLVNRADGSFIADIDVAPYEATHPDWSPDGSRLVISTGAGDAPGGAGLALLPWNGTSFGAATSLLEPTGDRSLLFPMFSPDGAQIAYTEGSGGHGDKSMLLFLTDPDDPAPVELARANRIVNNVETDGQHQNAGPTWAPAGDLWWIAFNTKRDFGVISDDGKQQIWVAAVDPALLGTGEDPSFPAFRLPAQGLDENNHRAFWALDVRYDLPDAGPEADAGPPPQDDAGAADAGSPPEQDAGPCAATGAACNPSGAGCCSVIDLCDTFDDGDTYVCYTAIGG